MPSLKSLSKFLFPLSIGIVTTCFIAISVAASVPQFSLRWMYSYYATDYDFRSMPAVTFYKDAVVLVNPSGVVFFLSKKTGKLLWKKNIGEPLSCGAAIDAISNQLYVCMQNGTIVSLNLEQHGKENWRKQLSIESIVRPTISEYGVHIRSQNGTIYTLSSLDGTIIWQYEKTVPKLSLTGGSELKLVGPLLVYGTDSGKLAILSAEQGKQIIEYPYSEKKYLSVVENISDIDGEIAVVNDSTLIATSFRGMIGAFSLNNGTLLWSSTIDKWLISKVVGDEVILISDSGYLYALSVYNGSVSWKMPIHNDATITDLSVSEDFILLADSDGYLQIYSLEHGKFFKKIKIHSKQYDIKKFKIVPDESDNSISYLVSNNGRIFSIRVR